MPTALMQEPISGTPIILDDRPAKIARLRRAATGFQVWHLTSGSLGASTVAICEVDPQFLIFTG
jgi:hypothetical protein